MLRAAPLTRRRWSSGRFDVGYDVVEDYGLFKPDAGKNFGVVALVDRRGRTVAAAGLTSDRPLIALGWLVLSPHCSPHLLSIIRECRRQLLGHLPLWRVVRAGIPDGIENQHFVERLLALLGFVPASTETYDWGLSVRWFEFRASGASHALH